MTELPEEIQQEQKEAPVEKLMEDNEFNRIYEMSMEEFVALDDDTRRKFFATNKWHFQQRTTCDSLQGFIFGNEEL